MELAKRTRFRDSFHAVADNIFNGPSTGKSSATNAYWEKWSPFFQDVSLDPLLILYRYPVPTPNAFARQYMTGVIDRVEIK